MAGHFFGRRRCHVSGGAALLPDIGRLWRFARRGTCRVRIRWRSVSRVGVLAGPNDLPRRCRGRTASRTAGFFQLMVAVAHRRAASPKACVRYEFLGF